MRMVVWKLFEIKVFHLPSQVLILFKLILLEKKVQIQTETNLFSFPAIQNFWEMTLVCLFWFSFCFLCLQVLFYVSPVNRLVGALMTVLSLFPGQQSSRLLLIKVGLCKEGAEVFLHVCQCDTKDKQQFNQQIMILCVISLTKMTKDYCSI